MNAANPWMRVWLINAMRSAAARKRCDTAQVFCDILVERYGDTRDGGDALWWFAEYLADHDETAKAAPLYRRLVEKFPGHLRAADAWFALGSTAREEHRWSDALAAFTELGKRHADSRRVAEAHYLCAGISRQIGDKKSERLYLERAAKAGPGNYYAHRALARLQDKEKPQKAHMLPVAGEKAFLGLFPKPEKAQVPLAPEQGSDPAAARVRFFGLNGLEEGDWEALECLLQAKDAAQRAARCQLLAEVGFMHTANQFFRAAQSAKGAEPSGGPSLWLDYPRAYGTLLKPIADAADVDPWLVLAVGRQESTFRSGIVSKSGAVGVMQLMPGTAKGLAKKNPAVKPDDADHLKHPASSLRLGAAYLHQMLARSDGNLIFALASYNAGPGNCDKWRKNFSGDDYESFVEGIPFAETKDYVKRVLGNYAAYHTLYPDSVP